MTIVVFSDHKSVQHLFSSLHKGRSHEVKIVPRENYRSRLKDEEKPFLVYFDIFQMDTSVYMKELRFLLKQADVAVGVIDPKGTMEDPALFFHEGGVDYIGAKLFKGKIPLKRIKSVCSFIGVNDEDSDNETVPNSLSLVNDWKEIREGHAYTFCFLYAELDLTHEWRRKSGQDHLKQVKERFHEYIRKAVEPHNGRIWMWNEYGGLVLFPYNGTPFHVVLAACKLVVNRSIAGCEQFPFKTPISFRLGIHIGETVYRERGNTGTIVSDSINFTFHLGSKYAVPGNMYITREVYDQTHPGLKDLFIREECFEGREIYRMRRVL
jgi:class 3 adenylate cyclase